MKTLQGLDAYGNVKFFTRLWDDIILKYNINKFLFNIFTVKDSTEILRTCITDVTDCKDIYPNGEILDCLICNTDLCNGQTDSQPEEPDNPDNSTCPPFNIAVNLKINFNILKNF